MALHFESLESRSFFLHNLTKATAFMVARMTESMTHSKYHEQTWKLPEAIVLESSLSPVTLDLCNSAVVISH